MTPQQSRRESNPSVVVGVDIGGANLKYCDTQGNSLAVEFPLWKRPDQLADQLCHDLSQFSPADHVAAVMTGELADCFLDRQEGVGHIADQLSRAADRLDLRPPVFYGVDGQFHVEADVAKHVDVIAAANWHALANNLALSGHPDGLLVDIGSTTTDLIPLRRGTVATQARTDFDRLREGTLVYVGGYRTPVSMIVGSLRYQEETVPVMREVFATMDDVAILLGVAAPSTDDDAHWSTADGKPRDRFHAANRMARTIGLDHRSVDIEAATVLAKQVQQVAAQLIADAAAGLAFEGEILLSGHADYLVQPLLEAYSVTRLSEHWGASTARAAPAYAVANLWQRALSH